jgi:hypothetical protein
MPNKIPTWAEANHCLGFKPIKERWLKRARNTPANKNRLPINNNGGISLTASLENIQLMAASSVTIMSNTSAFDEGFGKAVTTYEIKGTP